MDKKRIGVLGSGVAGKTLAQGFHRIGQDVRLGTRKPELLLDWKHNIDTDIEVVTPAEMAKKLVPKLREQGAEIIVALTHMVRYL